MKTIQEAKKRLEARQAEADRQKGRRKGDGRKSPRGGPPFARDFGVPEDKAQENFTDSESRIMKSSKGFEQCYNGQIAVDEDHQIIIATGLSHNAADAGELKPLIRKIRDVTGRLPERLLADAGYRSEKNLRRLEKLKIDAYVSLGREGNQDRSQACDPPATATQRMRAKLSTERGRRQYARRKAIPEPVYGWIKNVLGFRQFSLRGQRKAGGKWDLVCLATNLRRMSRLAPAAG